MKTRPINSKKSALSSKRTIAIRVGLVAIPLAVLLASQFATADKPKEFASSPPPSVILADAVSPDTKEASDGHARGAHKVKRAIRETHTKVVDFTVMKLVREQKRRTVSYTRMNIVREQVTRTDPVTGKKIAYSVARHVPEQFEKVVNYTVCNMVPEQRQKTIEYTTLRYETVEIPRQ